MSAKTRQIQPLNEWLGWALFFWLFLACWETAAGIIISALPPPLGQGTGPSAADVSAFLASLAIYALLSIPTALILSGTQGILAWMKKKRSARFFNASRMELCLLFAWGLLFFKWISNLISGLPYENPPCIFYLFILPLLVLQLWLKGFCRKEEACNKIQWAVIFLSAVFLSITSYKLFFDSCLSIFNRGFLFLLFAAAALFAAFCFYSLLRRILLSQIRIRAIYTVLFAVLLSGLGVTAFEKTDFSNTTVSRGPQSKGLRADDAGTTGNVIIVLVDCLRADHLPCYGYNLDTAPFLDSIAPSSTVFRNCISPASWTIPSVVSLFTGVCPQQHGVNKVDSIIPESLVTLQEAVERKGIKTAAFITNIYLNSRLGYSRGFSRFFDHYLQHNYNFKEYVASRLFFFNAFLHFTGELLNPEGDCDSGNRWWSFGLPPFNHKKRSAKRVTSDVLKWIQVNQDRPFYAYIHYMDVHSPYNPSWYPLFNKEIYPYQNHREKLINIYDGRISCVDRQIRRICNRLKQLNLSDKTLLIITADHGEEFFDHNMTGHGFSLYDELIRVPLILNNRFLSQQGQIVEKQVCLTDLPVTVLDFLDIKVPEQMKGESLLPFMQHDASLPSSPDLDYALSYTTRGRRQGAANDVVLSSLRVNNGWKIIVGDDNKTELFNLEEDEKEQNNLAGKEELMVSKLKKIFLEKSDQSGSLTPEKAEDVLSLDVRNELKALGYLH